MASYLAVALAVLATASAELPANNVDVYMLRENVMKTEVGLNIPLSE